MSPAALSEWEMGIAGFIVIGSSHAARLVEKLSRDGTVVVVASRSGWGLGGPPRHGSGKYCGNGWKLDKQRSSLPAVDNS